MQRRFRHYDVINVIDQQDTSSTYLVSLSSKPEQNFTLKVFHKPTLLSLATRGKFLQDVKTLSRMKHPHIVPVVEGGIEQGSAYIVNEYMPGGSLRDRLDRTSSARLPFQEAITIISQLGQALTYLHAQQIVHGRLRPEHVLFDAQGQALLAGVYYPEHTWLYDKDALIDVYNYLSSEQCQDTSGQQIGNAFSDQYALCCIAYKLFTGQTPFADTNILTLKEKLMHTNPASLRSLVANLPAAVDEAVLVGLAKDPTQRHADVATFLTTLQPFSHISTPAPNVTIPGDAALADKPESEKVWAELIYASETTPMILAPLVAPVASEAKQSIRAFDRQAASRKASATTTHARTIPWFAVILLTVIAVSVIMYMLLITYNPLLASIVQGAPNISQTSTTHAKNHSDVQSVSPTKATLNPLPIKSEATSTPRILSTPTAVATTIPTSTPVIRSTPTSTPIVSAPPAQPTPTPTQTAIQSLYAGQLNAQTKQSGSYTSAFIPGLTVSDVRIEADIASRGNSGGIIFRSGYRFRIGTDGSYDLVTSSSMLATGFSQAIETGNDVPNHITIVAKGSTITIAVNAQTLISINDSSYSSGSVAVMAIDFSESTTTTCNFSIYTA